MLIVHLALAAAVSSTAAPASAPSTDEAQIIALEKQSWAAWQKKDIPFWQRHLSGDHIEIDGPDGPQDRNYVLKGIAALPCEVANYNLDNFTFRQLGPDAAMVVYHSAQEFTCGDKHIPNVGWVTSVYQRRHGRWENLLFEHLVVPPPKAPAPPKP
jgi:hypothetical protein